MRALEKLGDVRGAFQVAVSMKTVNFKVNLATQGSNVLLQTTFLSICAILFSESESRCGEAERYVGTYF